ncbi:MAG: hypothetical protein V3W41_14980 [Planctomycetota bacterium]
MTDNEAAAPNENANPRNKASAPSSQGKAETPSSASSADTPASFRPKSAGDWDGQVRKVGAVCAETGKELVAGDEFVSLLRFGDEGIERTDLCVEAYEAKEHSDYFAYWRSHVAAPDSGKPRPLDLNFLTEFFRRLQAEGEPVEQREVAYIVTLLLVRRKILTIIRTEDEEGEQEFMILRFTKSEEDEEFRVSVPELSEEKMEAIRDDLSRIFNI